MPRLLPRHMGYLIRQTSNTTSIPIPFARSAIAAPLTTVNAKERTSGSRESSPPKTHGPFAHSAILRCDPITHIGHVPIIHDSEARFYPSLFFSLPLLKPVPKRNGFDQRDVRPNWCIVVFRLTIASFCLDYCKANKELGASVLLGAPQAAKCMLLN